MTTATVSSVPDLTVRVWRHHAPEASAVPGVDLGTDVITADVATEAGNLVARGARRVALTDPVDLAAPASPAAVVRDLVLIRELTSHAVAVDWRVRLAPDTDWRLLNHLHPPAGVTCAGVDPGEASGSGGDDVQREWASTFHLCRLVYRHGPGFVQVRDRRAGDLACLTIDDPDYLAAIEALRPGAPGSSVPAEILADFAGEGLVGTVGGIAWWMPYRVRRWPWPVMTI